MTLVSEKMQTFILHGLTGYVIYAMHDISTYVAIVFPYVRELPFACCSQIRLTGIVK